MQDEKVVSTPPNETLLVAFSKLSINNIASLKSPPWFKNCHDRNLFVRFLLIYVEDDLDHQYIGDCSL